MAVAEQRIYHDAEQLSMIILPLIPVATEVDEVFTHEQ
jgi:hypothetical protein